MTSARSNIRSTPRQIALVVLALLLAALFAYPGAGLFLGWTSTADGGIHRFYTVAWGVHTGLVLSVGLFSLLVRSEERVATAQQVGVAMAARKKLDTAQRAEPVGATEQRPMTARISSSFAF